MKFNYFEAWKVYQASSLGDINRKTGRRGNHPFIYLEPHLYNPTKSKGIMLTTKNSKFATLRLENILGNEETQNILISNIGYIDNDDIVNIWIYPKTNSHATIRYDTKEKIIKECNLEINIKSIKYENKNLLIQEMETKENLGKNFFISNDNKDKDFVKLLTQNEELITLCESLVNENKQLKSQIEGKNHEQTNFNEKEI